MNAFSPATRRIIAVALLVAAIALLWRLIVLPLQEHYQERADVAAAQQDLLERYRRLADSRGSLRARLDEMRRQPLSQEGYLTGDSETLVAAELQNLVRTTVERNGGRLESTQILPPANEAGYRRVTLRVRMSVGGEGLFRILYDLESSLPYLFVDGVDIVSRDRSGRRGGGKPADAGALGVSYDVSGYMRTG